MHLVKFGGSLGRSPASRALCAAWPLAATYIQWLNASVRDRVAGDVGDRVAGRLPELELPQPATAAAMTTKKAPSARMDRRDFIGPGRW